MVYKTITQRLSRLTGGGSGSRRDEERHHGEDTLPTAGMAATFRKSSRRSKLHRQKNAEKWEYL
jgi:hypothetical protein